MTANNDNNQDTAQALTTPPTERGKPTEGGEAKGLTNTFAIKKKTGRPTKLTPELQAKICKYVRDGNYFSTACQAVGINHQTFADWQKRGEEEANNGGGIYSSFLEALKRAEAEAEAELASMIKETALQKKEWLPGMAFLERRHRERWGRPAPIGITIDDHKEISITHVEYNLGPGQDIPQIVEGEVRELTEGEK